MTVPSTTAPPVATALSGGIDGAAALEPLVRTVLEALAAGAALRGGPVPGGEPAETVAAVAEAFRSPRRAYGVPRDGGSEETPGEALGAGEWNGMPPGHRRAAGAEAPDALAGLTRMLAHGSADPADSQCAAHLHCPPLAVAVAADLAVSALNPSQDSWDQAPAATTLETLLLEELAALVGYDPAASAGVLTSGGTESNLMGLMLARDRQGVDGADHRAAGGDRSGETHGGRLGTAAYPRPGSAAAGSPDAARVPDQASRRGAADGPDATSVHGPKSNGARAGVRDRRRRRILASEVAHFSVQRAAVLLGLGEDAVLPVPVDREHRMLPGALSQALEQCASRGEVPIAVVATAGTTDTGAIDPLRACAGLAAAHGAWLHVDASYGGGALLSDRLAPLLDGLGLADSVSLDWHKLGWQPAAAGVFLVRRAETYAPLARRAAYLNPLDDEEAGYPSLLGLSLRTTRRCDAFKIAVTLRTLGRSGLGSLVDACHDLAVAGADAVTAHPRLELHGRPTLTSLVFRYIPGVGGRFTGSTPGPADVTGDAVERAGARADAVNAALRRRLLREGRAVVGRTELPGEGPGRVRLKLTLLNPHTTASQVERLLEAVVAAGRAEEADSR